MSSATANQPFVFTPGSAPASAPGTDPLVNETRREIAEIVREVAMAVRSDRTAEEFLALLVDRILRAMAAEGVLVWQRSEDSATPYECVRRLGRVTDQSIPDESIATHMRMLTEVATDGSPVVVPGTPGASDPEVPANPMEVPVAVVPIECEPSSMGSDFVLEVFLEPNCGVATQRGYLRFVAQMADLAGEFLRADQLRRLRRGESLGRATDAAIAQLHKVQDRRKLEATIVDTASSLFGFDRVGLCDLGSRTELVSVSHVNAIDRNSPAARQLTQAASAELGPDSCAWTDLSDDVEADELAVRVVVASEPDSDHRLVCLQAADAKPLPSETGTQLSRYMHHAQLAMDAVARWDSVPGGRLLASLAPAMQSGRHRVMRKWVAAIAVLTLIVVAGIFPVPLIVYSPATIRPAAVQTLSAPRDAIVDHIHVRHGQNVARGDLLVSLVDPALEEQITTLVGRRAVLVQKRSRWTTELVDTASTRLDHLEQVQAEQSLVIEEIQSIDDQLAVLERIRTSLQIRADRDGIVDAWQIEQRLLARPLQRGDQMLLVIAEDSPWVADVRVPQSRIAHVQNATSHDELTARVALDAKPDEPLSASLVQIGPATESTQDGVASTAVLLQLSDQASQLIASGQGTSHHAGAPARVMFRCGRTPVAYLVFQDLIRSLRGTVALYSSADASADDAFQPNTPTREIDNDDVQPTSG